MFLFQGSPSVWWRDVTVGQQSTTSHGATFESSGSSTHLTAPSKWCEYCSTTDVSGWQPHKHIYMHAFHHSQSQTCFLLVGHFSPSISKWWQLREKSCACMHTCAPHYHSLAHTSTECALVECEWTWKEGGNKTQFCRKALGVGFAISFFPFSCHAAFPPDNVLTPVTSDVIHGSDSCGVSLQMKVLRHISWVAGYRRQESGNS